MRMMPTYDPHWGTTGDDDPSYLGRVILHRLMIRKSDPRSLDSWLGPALAIMLESFLDISEKTTMRDQWHEDMRRVVRDLRLMGTREYYSDDEIREKAEVAARKFADEIGGMWW